MKLLLFYVCVLYSISAAPLNLEVRAKSALLLNADTGVVLYEKNGYVPTYPGSTSKIGTALYFFEGKQIDVGQKVTVSAEAVKYNPGKRTDDVLSYLHERDGTKMGLVRGEILSLDAIVHGLMLSSANDAANVLAEHCCGSIPQFVDELNDYMRKIGCHNTYYMNPHGYHHSKLKSTPYDLCLMMQRLIKIPYLVEVMKKTSFVRPKSNKRAAEEMKQFNLMVVPGKKSYYPKAIGGKTGYHSKAGWCLVCVAEHDGRRLIASILGSATQAERYEDTRKLFEAAFNEKKMRRTYVPMGQTFTKSIEGGMKPLKATLNKDISLEYYPSEEPKLRAFVHWNPPAYPIPKGAVVGEIRLIDEREIVLVSENILASEPLTSTFLFSIKEKWNRFFR